MVYNFYHVTDVHYYSKRNFACDWRTFPQPSTQICILKSEEAFKKALEIVRNDENTNTVIITGDLTNYGDAYSHEEDEILVEVSPKFVEIWDTDEDNYAFQMFIDFDKEEVELKGYDEK